MIKKKVLVNGSLNSLSDFFSSPFNREFEPLAVIINEPKEVTQSVMSTGGALPEIFSIEEKIPRFVFRFIDGIVLTDVESRNEIITRLQKLGIEPRKIILWNNRGVIEYFNLRTKGGSTLVFMEGLQFHIRNEDDAKFFQEIHKLLQRQRQFYAINPEYYPAFVTQKYQSIIGKPLNWNNLRTWAEKMQWLKLYDSTPIKTRLADKYLVRQYVEEKIGVEYLIPLYGVWDKFDDIDFNLLPNQFVLKCNHGCDMNIICRDKNKFDFEGAKQKLTAWLQIDYGAFAFEPHYCHIPPKIIAEKFMTDSESVGLRDYKFWCFDGTSYYCGYESRDPDNPLAEEFPMDFFDMNWNHTNIERYDHPRNTKVTVFPKPKNFELMKKLAAELCKNFSFVRVDFYEIGDKVYFGEMTFTPYAGNIRWKSRGTDEYFGSLMTLPKEKYLFWEK